MAGALRCSHRGEHIISNTDAPLGQRLTPHKSVYEHPASRFFTAVETL
jgi:hypothetical protein